MSINNVVISLDSHHEAFLDLTNYLPSRLHASYKAECDTSIIKWRHALSYVAEMLHAGHVFSVESLGNTKNAPELAELDWRNFNRHYSIEERLAILDKDGVAAEMLIDSFGPYTTDPELQHALTLAYSRWFKDYVSPAPHRFTAAVITSLLCDVDVTVQEIHDAHEHGIRAIHLSPCPRSVSLALPHYNDRRYEPIWQALNERSMGVVFHSSPGREKPLWTWSGTERGWEALEMMDIESRHHATLKYFLLAGVLERYPNIHLGYVESGSSWVPPILERLDSIARGPRYDPAHKLDMLPSEQWHRQGYCTGPLGFDDIECRYKVGIGSLAFGSDFLHTEGTTPNTQAYLRRHFTDVSADERFAIIAGNAARIAKFDLEKLATTPAAQQPWFVEPELGAAA
jgi:predicted TIM-barrel fold metal-dependent hydrolase